MEILSQGDNWFIFHLLSAADLTSLKRANAHFSDDLLSSLLNEPIPGQGVFWSSVGGKPYPVSIRALSFERLFSMRDPDYNLPVGSTYAKTLLRTFGRENQLDLVNATGSTPSLTQKAMEEESEPIDIMAGIEAEAVNALRADKGLMTKLESDEGAAWGKVKAFFLEKLPEHLDDRDDLAYQLVKKAMDNIFGTQGHAWETFRNPSKVTYVRKKA